MSKNLSGKILIVSIILLFIGVSVSSAISINTNISPSSSTVISDVESIDNDLISVTVSICDTDKIVDYSKTLTQQQYMMLDNIFNNLKIDLDNANIEKETINIYHKAIESLYQYDLLPDDLSVEDAKKLVTTIDNKHPDLIKTSTKQNNNENFLCLISGVTGDTWIGLLPFTGIGILTVMGFGYYYYDPYEYPHHYYNSAQGWVYTTGLKGKINWEATEFFGQYFRFYRILYIYYCGGFGFTGIKYLANVIDVEFGYYFIGNALKVKLGLDRPRNIENQDIQNKQNYIHEINPFFLQFLKCFPLLERLLGLIK
jgi:hypothetical protein